jgi:hypothetical protein
MNAYSLLQSLYYTYDVRHKIYAHQSLKPTNEETEEISLTHHTNNLTLIPHLISSHYSAFTIT